MPTGSVKKFFADKGFGFIQPDDGTGDVFAPARTFAGDKHSVFEGLRVNFEGSLDEKTGKPMASSWFAEGGQAMPPNAAGYAMPGMQQQPIGSMGAGTGHLKRFYADKGYGFIARADGTGDLFAPARTFAGQEHEIQEGMQVSYEAGADDRSGKPRATSWGPLGSVGAGAFGMMGGMPGLGMDRFNPYGGFGGAAALPAGWESAADPSSGKTYYFNRGTGETSWEPPAAMAAMPAMPQAAPAPAALPAGWEAAPDPSSGKTYYFNRATGATQWDAPLY